ncbi:TraK family protein [Desulfovibrio sp. OttesenSCG-928-G11]|nr:TraK family protein [Desulfovibrio sp. OttesenSCG-928-G11]
MEARKTKIEFSTGRMEFIAVQEEILELCATGISKIKIYKQMYDKGKFTMHYNTFCYHLRKLESERNANRNQHGVAPGKQVQQQKANTLSTPERSSGSFIRPSDLSGKPLI